MLKVLVWLIAIGVVVLGLDRLLLWMESRSWIYYRRSRAGRGASMYHMLEIHSMVDPQIQHVIEVKVKEEKEEDEAGAPRVPEDSDESGGSRK